MIDNEGFRANVGIIVCNQEGKVLWAKRVSQQSWQFPQGGVNLGESPEQAMYRELFEEVGLKQKDVKLLGQTKGWLKYRLPQKLIRRDSRPLCVGQKQKWYLLKLTGQESRIQFDRGVSPEFDNWEWVTWWYPLEYVIPFKREVYRNALIQLMPMMSLELQKQRQQSVGQRAGGQRSKGAGSQKSTQKKYDSSKQGGAQRAGHIYKKRRGGHD